MVGTGFGVGDCLTVGVTGTVGNKVGDVTRFWVGDAVGTDAVVGA